jgi:hypothetical protein
LLKRLLTPILGLILLFGVAGLAEANGFPHRVVMTYTPDVSNWGPAGATGIGEFVPVEGEIRFTALGLPKDADGVYVLWLLNSKTKEAMALGQPKVDDQGVAGLNRVLPQAIPDKGWDTLLVSVEKSGTENKAPGDRRSIAGRIFDGNALPALQLPKTGGAEPSSAVAPVAPVAQAQPVVALGVALAIGVVAGGALTWLIARRRS